MSHQTERGREEKEKETGRDKMEKLREMFLMKVFQAYITVVGLVSNISILATIWRKNQEFINYIPLSSDKQTD
jgi:cell division septal protein FtsQ